MNGRVTMFVLSPPVSFSKGQVMFFTFFVVFNPFPDGKFLDSSKLKEFSDANFKFDENDRKSSKPVANTVGKGEIARHEQFSFFHSVFKILVKQTRKN